MFGRRKSKKGDDKNKCDKKACVEKDSVTSPALPGGTSRSCSSDRPTHDSEGTPSRLASVADTYPSYPYPASRLNDAGRYHQDTIDSGFCSKADSNLNLTSSGSSLHKGETEVSEPEMTSLLGQGQWPRSVVRASMKKAYEVCEPSQGQGCRPSSSPLLGGQSTNARRSASMYVPSKSSMIHPEVFITSNNNNNNNVTVLSTPQPIVSENSPKKHNKKNSKKEEKAEKSSSKKSGTLQLSVDSDETTVDSPTKKKSSLKLKRSASDHQKPAKGKHNKEQPHQSVPSIVASAAVPLLLHANSPHPTNYGYTISPPSTASSLSPQMSFNSGAPPSSSSNKATMSPAASFNLPRRPASISDAYNFISVDALCARSSQPSPTRRLTNGDISMTSRDAAQPVTISGPTRRYSASGWMPMKSSPLLAQRPQPLGSIVENTRVAEGGATGHTPGESSSPPPPLPPRLYQDESRLLQAPAERLPIASVRPVYVERQEGEGKRDGYADLLRRESARRYSEDITGVVRRPVSAVQSSRGEPSVSRRLSLDRDVGPNGRVAPSIYRRPSSALNSDLDLRAVKTATLEATGSLEYGSRKSVTRMSTGDSGYVEDVTMSHTESGDSSLHDHQYNSGYSNYGVQHQRNSVSDAYNTPSWRDIRRGSVPTSNRYDGGQKYPEHGDVTDARPSMGNVVYDTQKTVDTNVMYAWDEFNLQNSAVQRRHSYSQQPPPNNNIVNSTQLLSTSSLHVNGPTLNTGPPACVSFPNYRSSLTINSTASRSKNDSHNQGPDDGANEGVASPSYQPPPHPSWASRRSVPAAVVVATRRVADDPVGQGQEFHENIYSTVKKDFASSLNEQSTLSSIQPQRETSRYSNVNSSAMPKIADKQSVFEYDTAKSTPTNESKQQLSSFNNLPQLAAVDELATSFKHVHMDSDEEQISQPLLPTSLPPAAPFETMSSSPVKSVAVVHCMPAVPPNTLLADEQQFSNKSEDFSGDVEPMRELVESDSCDEQLLYVPAVSDDANGWLETERVMLAVSRDDGSGYSRQNNNVLPKFDEEYSLISGNKSPLIKVAPTVEMEIACMTVSNTVSDELLESSTAGPASDSNKSFEESVTPASNGNTDVQNSGEQTHDDSAWSGNSEVVLEYTQHKVEHFDGQTLNLKQQIEANDALGVQVEAVLVKKLSSRDVDKCQTYFNDLRTVTQLLVNLRSRISQHRNAASHTLADKKRGDALQEKYEDATNLRASVERRGKQVKVTVERYLTDEESRDFERYATSLPALLLQQAELEEKVRHGGHDKDVLIRVFDDERFEVDV